jgi:hypothetical protein
MPNINTLLPSKYLKKSDVTHEPVVTIRALAQVNVAQEGKPQELKWVMYFNEYEKGLVLNGTNIKLTAKAYGDESDGWVGKRVKLWNDESVTDLKGQLVGGIRIKTPKSAAPPAPVIVAPTAADTDFEDESSIPF